MTEDGAELDELAPKPPKPLEPISKDFRTGIAIGVLLGCAFGVGYLLGWGVDENSLHVSAMAWFFLTGLLTLAGMGVAAVVPDLIDTLKKG